MSCYPSNLLSKKWSDQPKLFVFSINQPMLRQVYTKYNCITPQYYRLCICSINDGSEYQRYWWWYWPCTTWSNHTSESLVLLPWTGVVSPPKHIPLGMQPCVMVNDPGYTHLTTPIRATHISKIILNALSFPIFLLLEVLWTVPTNLARFNFISKFVCLPSVFLGSMDIDTPMQS